MFSFSEWISCILVTGGYKERIQCHTAAEVLFGELETKKFPNLPVENCRFTMFIQDGKIIVCGGLNNLKKCLQLIDGTWEEHSTLNKRRVVHSTVTTQKATFVFGGIRSIDAVTRSKVLETTYEYLPKGSTTWLMGKTEIPLGFADGCTIAVKSDQEIWLIGGYKTKKRILSFNVRNHTFQVLPFNLNIGRASARCAFIPNTNKVMITGGYCSATYLKSTEIIDPEDGSVTMASKMKYKRIGHGMGIVTINGEDRLAVFGGYHEETLQRDSIEFYDNQNGKWERKSIKMKEARSSFGFLSLKLSDVISNM